MKDLTELLRQHPFTAGLDDEIINLIAGCASNVVFQANDYIFREGGNAEHFHLIRHGTVALEMKAPGREALSFLTIKDGDMLGSNWLVPPYRWSFDARAVELTRAVAFEATCLRTKCDADHHVGYEMMKRFVPPLLERLQIARFQGADIYSA